MQCILCTLTWAMLHAKIGNVHADMGDVHAKIGNMHTDMGDVHADMGNVHADMGRQTRTIRVSPPTMLPYMLLHLPVHPLCTAFNIQCVIILLHCSSLSGHNPCLRYATEPGGKGEGGGEGGKGGGESSWCAWTAHQFAPSPHLPAPAFGWCATQRRGQFAPADDAPSFSASALLLLLLHNV